MSAVFVHLLPDPCSLNLAATAVPAGCSSKRYRSRHPGSWALPKLTIVNVEVKEYLVPCQVLQSVRKMRSREGNVTQSCSDSDAGEEISQTRVELHSPGLWDGAGRDCRSLAAGSAPFIQSSFIRSSSTLFYSVEDIRKSLYCSEGEKSTLGPCLRWGWGLVCAARGAGARCPPPARAQPAFGALLWRGVVQGRLLAELDAR